MANYVIIGGDGKEYGPVTDADVRQWITEGRLAGTSLAKGEGDAEFRPLSKFPELATYFIPASLSMASAPPPITPPKAAPGDIPSPDNSGTGREAALQEARVPAICLKVVAGLNFVLAFWNLIKLILLHLAYGPLGMAEAVFGMVVSVLIFLGAMKMQSLKSFEFAFVAAVLAMIPCMTPCCVIGLPFGIWALVVLNKPTVKPHFG